MKRKLTMAPRLSVKTRATRHGEERHEGQVLTGGPLPSLARAEHPEERARAPAGLAARQEIADPEADQHGEPGREVVRVDEGPGEAPGGRAPPAQQPGLAAEVIEQAQKGQEPAEGQEGADEAVELRPRPDQVDHQEVGARVGQQQQQRAGGVGGGDGAEGEEAGTAGSQALPRGPAPSAPAGDSRARAAPAPGRPAARGAGRGPWQRHSSRRSATIRRHPAEQAEQDQELRDGQRPSLDRSERKRGPQQEAVESERGRDRPDRCAVERTMRAPYDATRGSAPQLQRGACA